MGERRAFFVIQYDPMSQLPVGFARTLAQNPAALDNFGRLPGQEKTHYVEGGHHSRSRAESRSLISELGYPGAF